MSANIYWIPVEPTCGESLNTMAPSHFIECMSAAFGPFPIILERMSLPVLYGMRACKLECIDDLIKNLEQHNTIKLWIEY